MNSRPGLTKADALTTYLQTQLLLRCLSCEKSHTEASDSSRAEPSLKTLGRQILNEKTILEPHFQETQGPKLMTPMDASPLPRAEEATLGGCWGGPIPLLSPPWTLGPQMSRGTGFKSFFPAL